MPSATPDILINKSKQREAYPPSRLAGLKPAKRGEVRNPRGRPKGSRHKLNEAFLAAMLEVWNEVGKETLRKFAETDPVEYVKLVASLLPPPDAKICQCEGMCEKDFNDLTAVLVDAIRADRDAREAKARGELEH